MISNHLL